MDEILIAYGAELKALGDGKVGGYLVRFSSADEPDLTGDFFTRETDFDLTEGRKSVPVLFHHGMDGTLKKRRLGRANLTVDDVGVWMEAQLTLRDEYEKAVYELVSAGKMGLSSGSASHMVERSADGKATHIKAWPIVEASITATPAEPRTAVIPLKSLVVPAEPEATTEAQAVAAVADNVSIEVIGEPNMSEELKTAAPNTEQDGALKAMEAKLSAMSDKLSDALKFMEDTPAIRKAGVYSVDGGKADSSIKGLGDFLLSVVRGDSQRLASVYGSVKTMEEGTGGSGGYLVPPEISTQLMQATVETSAVLPLVRRITVNSNVGEMPSLDQYVAPTAGVGNTAFAGGIKPTKRKESAAYTETETSFEMLKWQLNSMGGITYISNEMLSDAAAIEGILRGLIATAIAAREEYYVFRGTGVDEPLGILNSAAAIGVTPNTNNAVKYVDALSMFSQFKQVNSTPVWAMHPGIWPDIGVFEVSTGSGGVFQSNLGSGLGNSLLGYRIITSEHLPNPDTAGAFGLYDLGAYLLLEKGGLQIDFSEHAAFTTGRGVFRFTKRIAGMPWMKSYITLGSPTAYTVSPFVYHND